MYFGVILLLLLGSFSLGALPLTRWVVQLLSGKNLSQLGTGNISVSAAFSQGGKQAGIIAVILEIARGIIPVITAKILFPNTPVLQIVSLILLVAGRYFIAKGGGVTNATWGILVYSPIIAVSSGITGLMIWRVSYLLLPISKSSSRLWASRLGCLSAIFWVWFWHQKSQSPTFSPWELVAVIGLAVELVIINLAQKDDVGLYMKQQYFNLKDKLDIQHCGEKATRLSELKRAGFKVPLGWVLPAINRLEDINIPFKKQIQLTNYPLIIRSSAIGEDSNNSSAAGQYQTIGPIYSPTELQPAIIQCRQSYWNPEAISYRQNQHLPDAGIAVLIQPYLASEVAGVMFTRNPLDGGSQIIIEALRGGAELVVGGQFTPVHLEIEINTLIEELELPSFLPKTVILELVQLAQDIEAFYQGIPQDIEWCWDGVKVWILQTRPITNLRPIWTRTIAAEVIPGVIPPLTWSINRPLTCGVWGELFTLVLGKKVSHLDFKQTATLFASHAYFNASLLGEIFTLMGLPKQGLEFLVRGQKMGKPPLGKLFPSLPGLWRLIQRERHLDQDFKRDLEQLFLPTLQQIESHQSLELLTLTQLLEQSETLQKTLKLATYYNIIAPIGLAIRRSLFKVSDAWIPTHTSPEVASMQALQTLADQIRETFTETEPITHQSFEQKLAENQQFHQQFETWLQTYGYLSEVGTDISVPNWLEQPEIFKEMLFKIIKNVNYRMENLNVSNLNQWEKWRQAQCYERTLTKSKIAEVYGKLLAHLRWTILAIESQAITQGILENSGDIFYLEWDEIKAWIEQNIEPDFIPKVHQRRNIFQEDCDRTILPVVYGTILPKHRLQNIQNAAILQGIPASIGCVEGTIKICRSLTNIIDQTEDKILVVPYTDAGWSPILLTAKAIISEVGGQLSHGAIIAREYGIPAVMNIQGATTSLKDGQRVRVDGYQGTVEILED
ncbi:Putative phosphoenolpyruvate synthase [Planktothrix tepida]|uniref:Phosphoenolpyruvate synthase-like protein n=1 Tax=Planktothrix tepida PCC 9214 TaxID=671072 RepID=A0A1J1LFL8_9CYAN|nr:glycerol-3-phosphate acyltransferase [Planktothrix tepida]CAD5927853.1 Putative phosphoenolpyruvate synthase [Planktothrix tepida]CUR31383.1 Phosphoenolpyruvate synthase-like protein [Planktothrix tepida PCC 9214]